MSYRRPSGSRSVRWKAALSAPAPPPRIAIFSMPVLLASGAAGARHLRDRATHELAKGNWLVLRMEEALACDLASLARERARRLHARHHGGLDAFGVEARVDPRAGEEQVGEAGAIALESRCGGARCTGDTAAGRIHVGAHDLFVKPILAA